MKSGYVVNPSTPFEPFRGCINDSEELNEMKMRVLVEIMVTGMVTVASNRSIERHICKGTISDGKGGGGRIDERVLA